jgi:hypothetical protein
MGAQQITFLRRLWFAPFPITMSIFQHRNRARDSLRPFRMAWARILNAVWVMKNNHRDGD